MTPIISTAISRLLFPKLPEGGGTSSTLCQQRRHTALKCRKALCILLNPHHTFAVSNLVLSGAQIRNRFFANIANAFRHGRPRTAEGRDDK